MAEQCRHARTRHATLDIGRMNDGVGRRPKYPNENMRFLPLLISARLSLSLLARIVTRRIDAAHFFGAFHALAVDDGGGRDGNFDVLSRHCYKGPTGVVDAIQSAS